LDGTAMIRARVWCMIGLLIFAMGCVMVVLG
jgi:hypothetical protein